MKFSHCLSLLFVNIFFGCLLFSITLNDIKYYDIKF